MFSPPGVTHAQSFLGASRRADRGARRGHRVVASAWSQIARGVATWSAIASIAVAASATAACSRQPEQRARADSTTAAAAATVGTGALDVTDDGGHVIHLAHPAQRIISLIPSGTETLVALGVADRIVGRTRYDVEPQVQSATLVGGGIDPSLETIVGLHPDLVLTWENDKRLLVRNKLAQLGVPVFTVRTEDTSDVFRAIHTLGRLTGRDSAAIALSSTLHLALDTIHRSVAGKPRPTVLFVVYNNPPMTAGPTTFIGQLISLAGGKSISDDATTLWPNVAIEELVRRQPDIIVIPVGEFKSNSLARFRATPGWRDLTAIKEGHVLLIDADLATRPGPRIVESARMLRDAFHPELASHAPRLAVSHP